MGIFKAIGKLFLVLEDSAASQNVPFTDEDFTRKLFPNGIWDLVIQLAAFVVLLVVVFFIAYKPVKKMVAKRREYVALQIASAEEANRVAQEAAAKKDVTIEEGKAEAGRIVAEARIEAQKEAARILSEAEQSASEKKKQADIDIELAKQKSKDDVYREIVDVAIAASSQVLNREVNQKDNERLVNEFLEDLKDEKK